MWQKFVSGKNSWKPLGLNELTSFLAIERCRIPFTVPDSHHTGRRLLRRSLGGGTSMDSAPAAWRKLRRARSASQANENCESRGAAVRR